MLFRVNTEALPFHPFSRRFIIGKAYEQSLPWASIVGMFIWLGAITFFHQFEFAYLSFREMPRKVNYGLDYDDGYDNYDDYDYDHEVKGDGQDEDGKCHLFQYFGSLFQASVLVILPQCCILLPTTFLILISFSKYFLFGLHITTWNRCGISAW